jgi:hypothetical protein
MRIYALINGYLFNILSTLKDLIAVLCPFGPLRILVESSRNDKREIPALLYSGIIINCRIILFLNTC